MPRSRGMEGLVDEMIARLEEDAPLQFRQGIIMSVISNEAQVKVGKSIFENVRWIHPNVWRPKAGQTVYLLSNGQRGKDYFILGPGS